MKTWGGLGRNAEGPPVKNCQWLGWRRETPRPGHDSLSFLWHLGKSPPVLQRIDCFPSYLRNVYGCSFGNGYGLSNINWLTVVSWELSSRKLYSFWYWRHPRARNPHLTLLGNQNVKSRDWSTLSFPFRELSLRIKALLAGKLRQIFENIFRSITSL